MQRVMLHMFTHPRILAAPAVKILFPLAVTAACACMLVSALVQDL